MCRHEDKYCPRCNRLFECKVGNISQCQCNNIKLPEAVAAFIDRQYNDCLCLKCLQELAELSFSKENNQPGQYDF
ncbi:MAG: cysteine-rich CWC family protein [Ferruginibacter sp.]